jgi:hypothetical protein
MNTKRIIKVTIKRLADEGGEADYLGKYSNEPGEPSKTIDRRTLKHCGPGQLPFFIAENTENWEQSLANYTRMEAGMRGEWCLIGIKAEAEVHLTGDTVQRLTSGGLWGVESDGGDSYHKEIEGEQLEELMGELESVGFTEAEIKAAFANVETKSNY